MQFLGTFRAFLNNAFPKISFLALASRIAGSSKIFFVNILVLHSGHHLPLRSSQKQGSQCVKCTILCVLEGFFVNSTSPVGPIESCLRFLDSARRDASNDVSYASVV